MAINGLKMTQDNLSLVLYHSKPSTIIEVLIGKLTLKQGQEEVQFLSENLS